MGQDRKPPRGTPKLREKAEARLQSKAPGFQEFSLDEMHVLVHELQVHQIELEMQNAALRQSQISLEEANRQYRDFFDCAPVGFLTLDESGLIREVNLTAASQLGVTRRHLVDKPFRFFIEIEDRDRFRLYLKRVFQEPGPHSGEIKLQRPDKGSFFAHLDSVAVTDVSGARLCRTSITDISDLKQAEQKLQASERLFASFVGHLPSVAVIRDLEGRYLFANAAWEQAFQKRREEWLGKNSEELWPPEVAAKFKEQDRLVIESRAALQTMGSLRHRDGLHQWISHRFPIVDQDGHPVMIGINAIDVTEPMATKARLEQVLDSGPAAIYTCDPGRGFALSYISENTKTVVGWEARDFLADSRFWFQHVHPEDRPWVCKRLELPWPEDRQTHEYRFLAKDGAYRWMHDEVRLVRDADGKPVEMAGVWMDITDSKRAQAALEESLSLYKATLESTTDGLLVVDLKGRMVSWNQKFLEMWGIPEDIAASRDDDIALAYVLDQLLAPQAFLQKVMELYDEPSAESFDLLFFKDGRIFERYSIPQYLYTQIVGRVWSYRDVTEPKRAEEQLKNVNACLLDLGPDFEANIARLTGLCGEELGGTCALYNRLEGGMLCSRGQWHTPPDFESRDKPDGHICYDVIQHGGVDAMVVRNLPETAYATTDPNVNRYGLMTYVGHVVLCGGEPVGSLCVVFQEDVEPTDHDKSILGIIATSLGKEEERKRAEDAFKESESQYRLLVKQIPAVVFKGYQDWSVDFFDQKIESLTGYPKEEFDSRQLKWCDLILPEDLDMASGLFMQALKTDKSYVREYRIRKKDGEIAWIQARGQIFCDAAGQIDYVSGVFFDITERKAAEEALKETENQYRLLVNQIPAVVFKGYSDWRVDFLDRKVEELTGYHKEDFDSGKVKWYDLIHEDDFDYAQRVFIEALKTDKSYVREHRIRRKDGKIRWVQCRGQIFCDAEGKVDHISGVTFDITARKAAETLIHQERQRFFSLLDMLPALVCLVAPDHTLPFVNRQFREIFGDPQGRTCHELIFSRQEPCDRCQTLMVFETRQPVDYEWTSPQGRIYQIYDYPFADIDGSPMVLELGMDITERKTLEAELLQAQKMEAVGRLAGGVAHDFNNLLMAIMGYGELIRSSLIKDDPLYKYSEDILKASERAASLTQQLLAFSRRQVMQPQVLNLNRVAADLEKMLRRLIGEHIELDIVAGPELGAVKADPGQINQIIMNLAINARDAMPTGGRLILATANIEFTASHKSYSAAVPPGRYVRLAVTDTGSGVDAESLDHIFEPFFTTKEMGRGTGLGLPMVYGIVKQNRGYIEVDTRPGHGATFKIYLPRLEAAVEATEANMTLAAKLEGSETILVVEDEDALRTLLCRFFRLYGYNVMEARHGGEALLICERHSGPIHLMVTDVVMPQMSGKELADRLAPLHPEMTVFFMSGYTDSDLTGYGAPESSQHFIPKPFRPMDLVKKVRDFLDASRGGTAESPPS